MPCGSHAIAQLEGLPMLICMRFLLLGMVTIHVSCFQLLS